LRREISSVIIKWDTDKSDKNNEIRNTMMKKLAAFIITFAVFFVLYSACSAESGFKLHWEGNTYTVDEAVTSGSALSLKVARQDGAIRLSDEAAGIKASIRAYTLDEGAFQALRNYYNDKKSTEDQLFNKYVGLMRSYIPAMRNLYQTSYLYGNQDDPGSESGMKFFYEGHDRIFGQESAVYLYNIYTSDRLEFNEETHIDLSIPVKDTHTLISIGILLKGGSLNEEAAGKITALLGAIRPDGLEPQTEMLSIFGDKNILNAVNAGFYSARQNGSGELLVLEDARAGFSLSYPSNYVPYMQNSLGGRLQYRGYKIDPNNIFSISTEPLEPGMSSEYDILAASMPEGAENITEEGEQEIGGNTFGYIKYSAATTAGAIYVSDYFTTSGSMLYRLQLSSRFEEPSPEVLGDFGRTLESFDAQEPADGEPAGAPEAAVQYVDKEEGYSFSYPENWQLTDVTENISYDSFKLVYPGLSGPLDVTVSEGELSREIDPRDDLSYIMTGQRGSDEDSYIKNYRQPFDGRPLKLLNLSFRFEGSLVYAYRLLDYLDSNGRNRLAYCIDIINGKKIYSMFIAVGEYETDNGRIKYEDVNSAVNAIASSFRAGAAAESGERAAAGETRNWKVVFIENWLKTSIDPELKIASVEDTAPDGSIYVQVVNTGESGYYRVKPDFGNRRLEILDSTPAAIILNTELGKLKETYGKRIITGTYIDEAAMTISIDSRMNENSPVLRRTYRVDVTPAEGGGINWETVRANHAEELKRECEAFLSFLLASDIDLQFSYQDVFKDIEAYERRNMLYRTLVHVQTGSLDGFFILEIDPSDDDITAASYKSTEQLIKDIGYTYEYGLNGYETANADFDGKSFALRLTLKSKSDGSEKTEVIKLRYNQEKMTIEY
jgi:hypothetical protein